MKEITKEDYQLSDKTKFSTFIDDIEKYFESEDS